MTASKKVWIGIRFAIADERVGELNLRPVKYIICPELLQQNVCLQLYNPADLNFYMPDDNYNTLSGQGGKISK